MNGTNVRMRVALRDVSPEVWREFVVPDSISLDDLHEVLQAVMGWTNTHLHEFEVRGTRYAKSDAHDETRRHHP